MYYVRKPSQQIIATKDSNKFIRNFHLVRRDPLKPLRLIPSLNQPFNWLPTLILSRSNGVLSQPSNFSKLRKIPQ